MDNESQNPILITGAHRSGTTWLANMLGLSGDVLHVSEPFNLDSWAYRLDGLAQYWFTYAPELREADAVVAFQKVLDRKTGRVFGRRVIQRYIPFTRRGRLIIKDPIACLSSEWLSREFPMDVVVLVRHPAAFAASLKRMNWCFSFDNLLNQPLLMKELLSQYKGEFETVSADVVSQAALLWKAIYSVLGTFAARNPEWILVRHEDLSRAPQVELRHLYNELGLVWTENVERDIRKYTGQGNPVDPKEGVAHQMLRDSEKNISRWKKILQPGEVDKVRRIAEPVASQFYRQDEW